MPHHEPATPSENALNQQLDVDFALEAAGLGIWELDPNTQLVNWDQRCRQFFGITSDSNPELAYEKAAACIHPDDLPRVEQAIAWAMDVRSGGQYDVTYRTLGADDGLLRWVRFVGKSYFHPDGHVYRFAGVAQEVTQQVLAQQAVEETKARQIYLLTLSNRLRNLTDSYQIQYEAACLLGELLEADRVGYAEAQADDKLVAVTRNYTRGVSNLEGIYRYDDYGPALLASMQAGQTLVRPDIAGDPTLTDSEKEAHAGLQLGATLNVPLIKNGQLAAILFVHYKRPYSFSENQIALVQETAELIWLAIERVQAEEALRESENQFRLLADTLPQAIWINDTDGNVVFLNKWWTDYCGIPFELTTTSQVALDSIHPEDSPKLLATFAQAMQQGKGFAVEQRNLSASGEYRWFLNIGEPFRDPKTGHITKWVGVGVDINDRKQAEQALLQSEARFRSIIEQAPLAIGLLKGQDMRIELANEQLFRVWGKDSSITGLPLNEALPELRGQGFMDILQRVYNTGIPYTGHGAAATLMHQGKQETFYFDYTYAPLRAADGAVSGVMVIANEVTQQVLARQAIEASEAKLRSVILSAPAAMGLFVGPDLVIELPNQAFIDIVGKGPAIAGKPLREVMPELLTENQPFLAILDQVYRTGKTYQTTGALVKIVRQGVLTDNYYNITYSPLFDQSGQVYAVLDIAIDVTSQVQAQQALADSEQRYRQLASDLENRVAERTHELQQVNQDLVRSNDNLQQFAYVASHDLQEPLRKIQSFSTLLKEQLDDNQDTSVHDLLQRIGAAGARMSMLIKDLLTYSRIATRQQAFGPIPLAVVIDNALDTLSLVIQERGAQIQADALPLVNGDESQLSQLFQNLLSNAIKFTPANQPPRIQIRYARLSADALSKTIRPAKVASHYHQISVSDQGIGFDIKHLDRIFQVFQRLHGKSQFPGTGVGLAICERVIQNHGGSITASSEPGNGATFYVYLPA